MAKEGGKAMYSVLIADDDREIVESIAIFLKGEGYRVVKAYDGAQALLKAQTETLHLIILDIMMPNMDGVAALLRIREEKNIPVILLSAKSEDSDKILGLAAGADDYVTKPFNPSELMARVKSQIRRYTSLGGIVQEPEKIIVGGLLINTEEKSVSVDGEAVRLTPTEYKILCLLAKNRGKVFSSEEIYRRIWNEDYAVTDNSIAVHVRHIREKIEIDPKNPAYIKVVWGLGYKLE